MSAKNVKGILFTLENVLVSVKNLEYLAWKKVADEQSIFFDKKTFEQVKEQPCDIKLEKLLEQGARSYTPGEKMVLIARKNDVHYDLIEKITEKDILPGAEENLKALRSSKYTLAVVLQSYQEKAVLEKTGLGKYFDGKIGPDFCENGWCLADAAEKIGLEPGEVLAVVGTALLEERAIAENISLIVLNHIDENKTPKCGIIYVHAPTLEEIKIIDVLSPATIKEEKE